MIETVFILPLVMVVLVLLIYLGWNFRRLAVLTNVDRYATWEQVTPGSPGPDIQRLGGDMSNPRLNNAFFAFNNDSAARLDEHQATDGYLPESHERVRDLQADETYSYFDQFLEDHPRAIRERFEAEHTHRVDGFALFDLSDTMSSRASHNRLNGDWRYVNGVTQDGDDWEPGGYRVTPGLTLRDVFFVEMDEGLEPYDEGGNNLAAAIRMFYLQYPAYRGPDVSDSSSGWGIPDLDTAGPTAGF